MLPLAPQLRIMVWMNAHCTIHYGVRSTRTVVKAMRRGEGKVGTTFREVPDREPRSVVMERAMAHDTGTHYGVVRSSRYGVHTYATQRAGTL